MARSRCVHASARERGKKSVGVESNHSGWLGAALGCSWQARFYFAFALPKFLIEWSPDQSVHFFWKIIVLRKMCSYTCMQRQEEETGDVLCQHATPRLQLPPFIKNASALSDSVRPSMTSTFPNWATPRPSFPGSRLAWSNGPLWPCAHPSARPCSRAGMDCRLGPRSRQSRPALSVPGTYTTNR